MNNSQRIADNQTLTMAVKQIILFFKNYRFFGINGPTDEEPDLRMPGKGPGQRVLKIMIMKIVSFVTPEFSGI